LAAFGEGKFGRNGRTVCTLNSEPFASALFGFGWKKKEQNK
jgi:hypothetical protein